MPDPFKEEPTSHDPKNVADDMTQFAGAPGKVENADGMRASLIALSGWEIGREIDVTDCPKVLGRSVNADMSINAPSISRRHAQIDRIKENDGEYYIISDLKSSNGTFVNNAPASATPLKDGDRIRMGEVLFKFVLQDEIDARFHREIHRRIHYDALTGLLTMDAFRQRLDAVIRRCGRKGCFCLAMTDLDGLKRVNDTLGHLAGRMVVREMGAMIRQILRPEDLAGLYGGDEALILFSNADIDQAYEVAESLRKIIETRVFEYQGRQFGVTISQGLAEWPTHADTPEKLIAAADRALYAAKHAGRNRVCCAETL